MRKPALLLLAIACCAVIVDAQSPRPCQPPALQATSQETNFFSEKQEADLGDAIAEHIQRNWRVIDDEEVTGNLARIGNRIVKHLPPSNLRFQFLLVEIPDANAFVLPGGRVYFSRKLVAFAQSEDEIAGVIGHEIGHLLARQQSIRMTKLMREVLGVTEVKDRRDIFEKYNQLMENAARKPKAFARNDTREDDQIVADQVGLFAVASAGYDPNANAQFFDRLTENKGKTGNFFSDLFGTTRPESRRVREMMKLAATLPPSCIESRDAGSADEFKRWQTSVVNYTGLGRRESLHAVIKKYSLDPPLRGEIEHLRFSPDGKYVLAQDESGVNVLSAEPFAPLFRIEAAEAKPAQFSPDSRDVIVYDSYLRVEVWSIADQKLKTAHEVLARKRCLQTLLSPDGKTLACLETNLDLSLVDVATSTQIFQKKDFYTPSIFDLFLARLQHALSNEESDDTEREWINMGYSPDGRYFAAGAQNTNFNTLGNFATAISALAVDLTTKESIALRGPLKKLLGGGFTFVSPDRLVGIDRSDPRKSLLVSFPAGETIDQLPLGNAQIASATRGNYLLIRPITNYPLGVMDLSTKKIFMANKQSAFDAYDKVFVSERTNGELGLYGFDKTEMRAKVVLPRNPLGRLRVSALSPDMKWLAVSERKRGGVWNLAKGERTYLVRGFRGGYFADDGAFYADFPKLEPAERGVARLDLTKRDVMAGAEIKDARATQHGPFLVITKPAKKDGGFTENVVIEVRDVRTSASLWSRPFLKESPRVWVDPQEQTMVLSWAVSSSAAQAEIKADPELSRQLATMKEKEGDYFLQVIDAATGKALGRLLIETGKASFQVTRVFVAGDWVIVSDNQNRVLVYSLRTGEQKGKVFGGRAAISPASKLLSVENESGKLTLYDLGTMQERDRFTFSSPISLARFSSDGKSLFVLTARQTAYLLDVSSPPR